MKRFKILILMYVGNCTLGLREAFLSAGKSVDSGPEGTHIIYTV